MKIFVMLLLLVLAFGWTSPWLKKQSGDSATLRQPLYWVAPMDSHYRRD